MSATQQLLSSFSAAALPPAGVTWNPSDKGATINLASGDLSATRVSGSNTYIGVRATAPVTAKSYWEIAVTWGGAGGRAGLGLARSGVSLDTNSDYIGGTVDSASLFGPRNDTYYNGPVSDYSDSSGASVYAFAFDPATGNLWIRELVVSPSAWFGSGDPATGTSPTLTIGATADYFPAIQVLSGVTEAFVINSGQAAFVGTAPSGFASGIT